MPARIVRAAARAANRPHPSALPESLRMADILQPSCGNLYRQVSDPVAHELGDRLDEASEVGFQPIEAGRLFEGLLVHVKRAIDLDLEAVPVRLRPAMAADDLDPLVAVI